MPYQFKWLGNYGLDVGIRFARLRRKFGDGKEETTLVGHSDGVRFYSLVYSSLPQSQGPTILDDQTSTQMSRFDYVWNFFVKRMQDGDYFTMVDPRDGTTVNCLFEDDELSFSQFAAKLYSGNLRIKQYRS